MYDTLSSLQAYHLRLKSTVEPYLNEDGQYLKMKTQLEYRTLNNEVLNKWASLLDKLGEAWASVERLVRNLIGQLLLLPKLLSEESYLRLILSEEKRMNRSCTVN